MIFRYLSSICFVIWSITMVSCEDSSEKTQSENQILNHANALYGDQKYVFPELTIEAKKHVSNWAVYDDFENEVKSLNGKTIEALQYKSKLLVSHIDSLSKNIPDTLYSQAIFSRVIVVKTRNNLLHQELNKSRIDSVRLQDYINEMNISVSNLIIQINEKFQKDAIDLKRIENEKEELENQKRFLDSVYHPETSGELQDKKSK